MTARHYLRRHWLAVALLAASAGILGPRSCCCARCRPAPSPWPPARKQRLPRDRQVLPRHPDAIGRRPAVDVDQRRGGKPRAAARSALGRACRLVQGGNARGSDANVVKSLGTLSLSRYGCSIAAKWGRSTSTACTAARCRSARRTTVRSARARSAAAQQHQPGRGRVAHARDPGDRGEAVQRRDRRRDDDGVLELAGGEASSPTNASARHLPPRRCLRAAVAVSPAG